MFKTCNVIKKRLQHRCFPANIANFLRTAFFIEHFCWLLLHFIFSSCKLRLYNFKSWIVVYMKRYFMLIHFQFYFRNLFFTHGYFIYTSYFSKVWSNWFDQINVSNFAISVISFYAPTQKWVVTICFGVFCIFFINNMNVLLQTILTSLLWHLSP